MLGSELKLTLPGALVEVFERLQERAGFTGLRVVPDLREDEYAHELLERFLGGSLLKLCPADPVQRLGQTGRRIGLGQAAGSVSLEVRNQAVIVFRYTVDFTGLEDRVRVERARLRPHAGELRGGRVELAQSHQGVAEQHAGGGRMGAVRVLI